MLANGLVGTEVKAANSYNWQVARRVKAKKKFVPRRAIYSEALDAMVEASKLFPNQDPIRLASGLLAFKMPMPRVMAVLRRLAPHFKDANADMIRLAAGFNELSQSIRASRIDSVVSELKKNI
jgi:hypothetical protein